MFRFDEEENEFPLVNIRVVGVGGGGGNAVNNMISHSLKGASFIAANTDNQVLYLNNAPLKIQLGEVLTKGRGAGADPHVGRDAALESVNGIREALTGSEMVFVAASLGGGTGTGAGPVIASIAKEMGALTVGVVTRPFQFEGAQKAKVSEDGLQEMKKCCHSVIVIPNDRLLSVVEQATTVDAALLVADDILRQAISGITDLIVQPGKINVDFADVRTIMSYSGRAVMGMGTASGEHRAVEAAQKAISSPLLEDGTIDGARGVLINIAGGRDMTLHEVAKASEIITGKVSKEAKVIFGTSASGDDSDTIRVTVIATGFHEEESNSMDMGAGRNLKKGMGIDMEKRGVLRKVPRVIGGNPFCESEWEVPTFLRRQAD
jgi:cell division protein FtsZ